ncbi:MAG: DUF4390 domain-containing protein, partial [Bdellovibrionales bacterium]|nr:DUF4390 domain-containing protein [Bdellovibrionales bacterium]
MNLFLSILISTIFAAPNLQVHWNTQEKKELLVSALGEENFIKDCISQGLDAEYRFHVQLCRRRSMWYDGCKDTFRFKQSLRYDPISQKYLISGDWLDDKIPPQSTSTDTLAEASKSLATIDSV